MDSGLPVPLVGGEVEVSEKAHRRRFTLEYKRQVLKQADACTRSGEIGALLRREGLFSSQLAAWRAARERGEIAGLAPKKRGRMARRPDDRDRRIVSLERENAKLQARLQRAEALIELQKKVSSLLGIALPENGESK